LNMILGDKSLDFDILRSAASQNLTIDGSFFSKRDLAKLANSQTNLKTMTLDEFPTEHDIVNNNNSCVFLIAYDRCGSGVDHSNGKNAHWCVVSGHFTSADEAINPLLLYCQHSNSPSPFIVEYERLRNSNAQLGGCEGSSFVQKYKCTVDLCGGIQVWGN